jgi:hypothetical protein
LRRVTKLRFLRLVALRRLRRAFETLHPIPRTSRDRKIIVGYCTLEVVDLWGTFVRAFYVSSALGAQRRRGQRITCAISFARPADALEYAAQWHFLRRNPGGSPPRYRQENEPAWHRPNNISRLAGTLSFSNESTITAALSRARRSIDDLVDFRNYFAHRNAYSKASVTAALYRYAITPEHSVESSLCQKTPRSPAPLIELLLNDVHDTIDLMTR